MGNMATETRSQVSGTLRSESDTPRSSDGSLAQSAVDFARQAERLSYRKPLEGVPADVAVEARFITQHDPVIITAEGNRLPAVPLGEAHKLNVLREGLEGDKAGEPTKLIKLSAKHNGHSIQKPGEGSLRMAMPPSHTNPLFPPLPLYGPSSRLRDLQCATFRVSAFFLSLAFLGVIVLGAIFTSLPPFCIRVIRLVTLRNPDRRRPLYDEEERRKRLRKDADVAWKGRRSRERVRERDDENAGGDGDGFIPTEGGPDPIVCDVGYYARRVGLDMEAFRVQTEDGFLLDLWHVYDPREHSPLSAEERSDRGPGLFREPKKKPGAGPEGQKPKFPVLLMHGLLQSAGAYCVNDDDSLAFYLCKSGYDVWLGNNRCGFKPGHVLLEYSDPRMWCWNIRQMGVFDLPALTSRVLHETGFDKVGLVCHSQGTTEAFVALAKEQRPDLGERLSVFCALAPAAYAGPLIGKMYFKFMRVISPAMFRLMFGIHAFIPAMMTMHSLLNPRVYGWLGYKVFSFLFDWTDRRWDRGLRDRMFQFAPVYVSAESMRWWLGRECFAKHKCILATKEEWRAEEREDSEEARKQPSSSSAPAPQQQQQQQQQHPEKAANPDRTDERAVQAHRRKPRGAKAWYNEKAPPFALWVCGNDALVDGERLLRRFEKGREPHVNLVHSKVIPEFEHLDVIWAMDAPDRVFREVREVLWKTCNARDLCRVPRGCDAVSAWMPPAAQVGSDDDQLQSGSSSEDLSWP